MDLRYKLNDRPPVGQLLLYSLQWFVLAVAVVITSLFIAVGSPAERVLYAQKVFAQVFISDVEPLAYMEEHGLMMVSDAGAIEKAVDEVLAENEGVIADYHNGKDKAFGFLVGQVMKKMKGKGDPAKVNELLKGKL